MNWIERLYEIKNKDLYSQNGEGLLLEHISNALGFNTGTIDDIGGGDGLYLSNSRHLQNLGWDRYVIDRERGQTVTVENILDIPLFLFERNTATVLSIDIDGNDYWILDTILQHRKPSIIVAEFNATYTNSRTIAYNPDHVWAGDSYYGFTFAAGCKLAERFGYRVIFQVANMNMIMVRSELVTVRVPSITVKQNHYFKMSDRTDWVDV